VASILVIEDDRAIGGTLESSLRRHGYEVVWVTEGRSALREGTARPFDLVLIDLGLPDLDGVAVCRQLRQSLPSAVLVMLTARDTEMDIIVGLEAGADDYLTKPVRLGELLARVHAHLRRANGVIPPSPVLRVGDLTVDLASRRASVGEQELSLRAKEFDLLARLAREPDSAVSRETLMADVWDQHWHGSTKTLDVHVGWLRRRIGSCVDTGRVPTITTLRGHGYRLEVVDGGNPATGGPG
jgi:DNA-binding response OmpR family regulator